MKTTSRRVYFGAVVIGIGLAAGAVSTASPQASYVRTDSQVEPQQEEKVVTTPGVKHVTTPEPMYAIYMSQCVVGTPSFRDSLVQFIEDTKLNAVVIDIKDFTGKISFETENPKLIASISDECGARDMKAFIERLHASDIYVIGRITVFQDPNYTKLHPEQSVQSNSRPGEPWKDRKGLSFIAVNAEPYWEYVVELSKESYAIGFDELNYDYVRWPSDGNMADVHYPSSDRAGELEKFFKYLHEHVSPIGVKMSADLFGYTTVLTDDLGIGQQLERALPYFDYVAPMVYPSHYNKGFAGLADPNSDTYKVVYTSMLEAVRRAVATTTSVPGLAHTRIGTSTPAIYSKPAHDPKKLRPWLQDFDYGKDYTVADILAQTKATYDAGLTSWFFWDPANKYPSLRAALHNESAPTTQ